METSGEQTALGAGHTVPATLDGNVLKAYYAQRVCVKIADKATVSSSVQVNFE